MNRIYRLVWNAALNLWVAVAENARGRGKAGSARNKAALLMLVPLSALMHQAQAADAANAAVVSGAGTVATSGVTTTINQTTQKLAIDWTSLSTRANEALVFNQPNAQAIALNRIIGSSPSELLGSLTANGQVFILNPNGVLFGAGSQVNVGGLVASTLSLSNADFEAGNYKFTGSGSGSVINQGALNAGQGGYLALLAPEVRNEGVMTASLGTALLAAGNKVTLNLDNGSLLGYSIDQGAINALAENKQLIKADGGQVLLGAKALNSLTAATVNNTGVIEAKTIQNKAGRIMLMGDMDTGTVNVAGTLDASAPNTDGMGGDGGFIETSAAHVKVAAGTRVTTQAASGRTGQWLIDPQDYTVAASGGDITGADLSANLGTTNVTLLSSGGAAAGNGDININDAVSWSANTLTLTAARDVNFNAVASATGSAGLVMNTGTANGADAAVAGGLVKMALGPGGFTGRVDMATGTSLNINGEAYTIVNSLGAEGVLSGNDLQGMYGNPAARFVLGSDIDASATSTWNSGAGFTSLANFSGRFNGLGHNISNLTVNRPGVNEVGLFGRLETGARVGNVGLAGGSFTGLTGVGALVGGAAAITDTVVYNSYATAAVNGSVTFGGLVGHGGNMSILNSYATGAVTGDASSGQSAGGLVGAFSSGGKISNSYATGNVSSSGNSARVGGLVGNAGNSAAITGSYATGAVSGGGTSANVGGLVGFGFALSITGSHAAGAVTAAGASSMAGGLVGQLPVSSSIATSYASGNVSSGGSFVGGLVGFMNPSNISASYATGSVTVTGNPSISQAGGLAGAASGGTITGSYATGAVLGTGAVAGTSGVGGLVGSASSTTIDNSYATGTVGVNATGNSGARRVGGLVGSLSGGAISNSYATGAVTGPLYVGGLVGLMTSFSSSVSITASYATGSVTNTGITGEAGGLVGFSNAETGTISNSYATGNVDNGASGHAGGGLIGLFNATTTVSNSYATGAVSGAGFRGGLVGSGLGSLVNNFWNSSTSTTDFGFGETSSNTGAAPLTSAQFTNGANFTGAGWSVANTGGSSAVWRIYEGHTGPLLRSLLRVVTLADAADASLVYNGGTQTAAATTNTEPGLLGAAATGRNAGFYNGYYSTQQGGLDIVGGNLTITRANLTVSSSDVSRAYTGDTTAAGSAVVTGGALQGSDLLSGGSFAFADKHVGTGKTVNVSGITVADGNGGANYNLTLVDNTTSTISKADLTVTAAGVIKTYDGTLSAAGSATVDPLAGAGAGEVVNTAATQAFTDKNFGVGNKTVRASGLTIKDSGNADVTGNYNISYVDNTTSTINKADLTVTATGVNKTYDGTASATGAGSVSTLAGAGAGEVVNTAATQVFTDKNFGLGNKTVQASGLTIKDSGNVDVTGNYNIAYVDNTTSTINRANLTVTADAVTKTYDGTLAAAGSGTVGTLAGAGAGEVVNTAATQAFTDKNFGVGNKTVQASGLTIKDSGNVDVTGNYNIAYVDNTVSTINKADVTLSTSDVTRTYDGTTGAAGSVVVTAGTVFVGDSATGGTFAFTNKNAGTGNKTVTTTGVTVGDGVNNANYNVTYADNTTSTINKANLVLTTNDVTKTYDGTLSAVGTATVASGAVFTGDSISGGSFAFTDKNVGSGNKTVTTAGVTVTDGNGGNNYNVTYADNTTSTINQANLTLSTSNVTKTYDGTLGATGAVVVTAGTVFAGDNTSGGSFAFTDKNAGTGNKAVATSGVTVGDGVNNGNYNISYVDNTTSTINRANVTLSTSDVTKTYDSTTSAAGTAVVTSGTVFGGDSLTGGTFAFTDKNFGVGNKTVTTAGVTVGDGVNNANYNVSYANNTTSTINKADLTVTASGVNKVYDGTTAATVGYGDNRLGSDVLSVTGAASFADKNAGAGKSVGVNSIAVGGTDAGNYNLLNTTATTTATITPKALTVTAAGDSKNYDGVAYSGGKGVSYSGFVAGDSVSDIGGTLAYGGSSQGAVAAGNYLITPGGLNSISGNYALGFTSGALSITAVDASSASLGGLTLVGAYDSAMQALAGVGAPGGGFGGSAAADALAAAAAEAGNTDEK
ncbi:YDG domain-containing protein [Polaromonas sp. YR568]|uniref:YDG domain-containing protein n=1 Tax=Polaromonas sp. YR568 TaxID=1855301 RepID=UPI0015873B11|nr:YDG domain-containing protein [Polaromonas sp. YR568]